MAAPFRLDEQVSIEAKSTARDPDYGTEVESWSVVADHVWANTQDILPSRTMESTINGARVARQQTRLRIRINPAITAAMRVTLHGKGGRVMQVIAGPALLDDRRHVEFLLEGYGA
jgi:head-tail adaptor